MNNTIMMGRLVWDPQINMENIQEHFGQSAYHIIRENPFRLCEIKGFAFLTVDPIAMKAKNFRPENPLRIKAAVFHVIKFLNPHAYITRNSTGAIYSRFGDRLLALNLSAPAKKRHSCISLNSWGCLWKSPFTLISGI